MYTRFQYFIPKINAINTFVATMSLNLSEVFCALFKGFQNEKFYTECFLENLKKIIWNSLPIATLTVSASSIIYSIHVAPEFSTRGLNIYFGGIVALALVREGIPVMGSLAIITHYCSGITAQIGSMRVTEQLDAMKLSKVSPALYLLLPMLLAGLICFPILIVICILVGIFVNFITTTLLVQISYNLYTTSILNALMLKDIFLALVKAASFGFVATLISYVSGILTAGGAKGVGNSTRLSVVLNFAIIIILDYIITALWL